LPKRVDRQQDVFCKASQIGPLPDRDSIHTHAGIQAMPYDRCLYDRG